MSKIWTKIRRKWMKIRLQPIRVFCLHHVSEVYDPSTMWECDWTQIEQFKCSILRLRENGVKFISLQVAYEKLKQDKFRLKKYAVLTVDDGYKSLLNILPWLQEQQIPVTLFVNPKYILVDAIGDNIKQYKVSKTSNEVYLNINDIANIISPLVTFACHGYEHLDEWKIDKEAFDQNVKLCIKSMNECFPNVIPFYAHTYGHAKLENDKLLSSYGLIPVYVSGNKNYNDATRIDRELISNERIEKGMLL